MGWFSKREPQPDPIGDICRLLVERPWEWTNYTTSERDVRDRTPALKHASGLCVTWRNTGTPEVWFAPTDETKFMPVLRHDALLLFNAVLNHVVAKAKRPRASFDDATKAVARAVLDGDAEAARQLADWVMEHCGGTKGDA